MLGAEAKVSLRLIRDSMERTRITEPRFCERTLPQTFSVDVVHYAAFFKSHLSMPSLRRDGFIEMNSEELCGLFCGDSLVFFEEF